MVTDKVSDLIIQIKNAGLANKSTCVIDYSKLKQTILKKMQVHRYVDSFEIKGHGPKKKIVVNIATLKNGKKRVLDVKRISKPSRRVYKGYKSLFPFKNSFGTIILSTPKGVLTLEEARKENVGGEILFSIW